MSKNILKIGPYFLNSDGWYENIPPKKDGDSKRIVWLVLL